MSAAVSTPEAEPKCPVCGGAVSPGRRGRPRMYCTTRCASTAGQRVKRERDREVLSKQQRLLIAGAVAPRLRSKQPSRRRIHVTNAMGEVVRKITDTELALGIMKTAAIEFQVDAPDGKGTTKECVVCGRLTQRRLRGSGSQSTKCIECKNGKCADCGAIFTSESTAREARRRGNVARCRPCRFAWLRKGKAGPSKMTRKELEARIAELEAAATRSGGPDV